MRYTKKLKNGSYNVPYHVFEALNKLGALEDIEDELGVDIATLLKSVINGCWVKTGGKWSAILDNENCCFIYPRFLHLCHGSYAEYKTTKDYDDGEPPSLEENNALILCEMSYGGHIFVARVKDYGRTWALTREELEEHK